MEELRVRSHPVLSVPGGERVRFYWKGMAVNARRGEMISSALFANGVKVFGHHQKDDAPVGMFCANGQCSQCLVLMDGIPIKSCMTPVEEGIHVEPMDGLPELPKIREVPVNRKKEKIEVPVLILGGGPAGMSAALDLGKAGVRCLLIDDKQDLGGKLVLQSHRFFGSIEAVYAGTRGIDIGKILENDLEEFSCVEVWTNSTALAVFSDNKVGILKDGKDYVLIEPEILLVTTGAREKSLVFKGNTLPGVYGAGAFQTLVNRDLVKVSERLFIVGGGNVGLIVGYHALQAGIEVVGLIEAMTECGGYAVHRDKLVRSGVPVYTSHTIVSANGTDLVDSVTIAQIDSDFNVVPGTEKTFACDTILIAVGLDPVDEFYLKAKEYGMKVFAAGDAEEIAEASAAMFSGRIRGLEIARALGASSGSIPEDWYETMNILKSRPGPVRDLDDSYYGKGVYPVFHCNQEIPCNPCTSVCPFNLITIDPGDIMKVPEYRENEQGKGCTGCGKCLVICPGLAITIVDGRKDSEFPTVSIPFEFSEERLETGSLVTALDQEGAVLGDFPVLAIRKAEKRKGTWIVKIQVPRGTSDRVAGIRVQDPEVTIPLDEPISRITDDTIVCRCERVTAGEVRTLVREGMTDMNEIKAATRSGMGSCGGKTCTPIIERLLAEEGHRDDYTENVKRPLFVEVPLGIFAGVKDK
jgi:NADPH-dependent 2,4-dienoyl-CoA reductase/sulfur reductase-like enzyme/ferredoxin